MIYRIWPGPRSDSPTELSPIPPKLIDHLPAQIPTLLPICERRHLAYGLILVVLLAAGPLLWSHAEVIQGLIIVDGASLAFIALAAARDAAIPGSVWCWP